MGVKLFSEEQTASLENIFSNGPVCIKHGDKVVAKFSGYRGKSGYRDMPATEVAAAFSGAENPWFAATVVSVNSGTEVAIEYNVLSVACQEDYDDIFDAPDVQGPVWTVTANEVLICNDRPDNYRNEVAPDGAIPVEDFTSGYAAVKEEADKIAGAGMMIMSHRTNQDGDIISEQLADNNGKLCLDPWNHVIYPSIEKPDIVGQLSSANNSSMFLSDAGIVPWTISDAGLSDPVTGHRRFFITSHRGAQLEFDPMSECVGMSGDDGGRPSDKGLYWKTGNNDNYSGVVHFSCSFTHIQKDVTFASPEEFFAHRGEHGFPVDWSLISTLGTKQMWTISDAGTVSHSDALHPCHEITWKTLFEKSSVVRLRNDYEIARSGLSRHEVCLEPQVGLSRLRAFSCEKWPVRALEQWTITRLPEAEAAAAKVLIDRGMQKTKNNRQERKERHEMLRKNGFQCSDTDDPDGTIAYEAANLNWQDD